MPDEVPLRKKLLPTVGRGLWYICGVILLLSLPTFSYLVPTFQGPARNEQSPGSSGFVSREESRKVGEGYAPRDDHFVRNNAGGFFSRGSYSGDARSASRSRLSAVRASRAGTRSQRGLNRLARERETQAANRVENAGESAESDAKNEEQEFFKGAEDELTQMEQDYQSTLNYLFPAQSQYYGPQNNNPFQSALTGQGGGGMFNDPSGNQDPVDDADSGEGDGSDDTGGGSEGEGSSGSSDTDDDSDDGEEEPEVYNFLVLGRFAGSDKVLTVSRAFQEGAGSYVLEDGSELNFFASSGVVGIPHTAFLLSEDEMLLSADFNGDGSDDVVVGGWDYPATYLRGYVRRGQVASKPEFEAVLQFVKIQAIAAYDFESDGTNELAVLFSGNPNLVIYRVEDQKLRYSREMSVPFEPSVLVSTQDQGAFRQRYLQVFDKSLQRSIVFSSLFPGAYSFSKPSSFRSVRAIKLDSPGESIQGEEFSVLRYDDVVVVVENREDDVTFIASFRYTEGYSKLAIGRSADDGSRQILFVPKGG